MHPVIMITLLHAEFIVVQQQQPQQQEHNNSDVTVDGNSMAAAALSAGIGLLGGMIIAGALSADKDEDEA